ncbi:MAG: phage portal protein [Cyanobacteriota bacterium]|nr:phage portal protein [Cyanobacteriota bacterium]
MAGKKATRDQLELALKSAQKELAVTYLRAFESAKESRRTENWYTRNGGPNADIRTAWSLLTRRHQDLVDSNPWANRAVRVITNNWVGDGIIGSPMGGSKRYDQAWNDWADTIDCDHAGNLNWYGLQALIARTTAVRGSCLIRRHVDERMIDQGLVPLRLQVMEPDMLDFSRDDGSRIKFGKQYSIEGRLEGYYIRQTHPGETEWNGVRIQSEFVPASEILHTYEVNRPGQAIGVPFGAAVLLHLRDIDDIAQAMLLKAKIAACFTAFVYSNEPDESASVTALTETLEPGAIEILPDGKQITFANPPVAPDYVEHQKYHLHAVAAGYGITFEALTGILSDVNFSSGRMGWIEFHRQIAAWRWNLTIPQVMDPVHRWFNDAARLAQVRGPRRMIWTPPRRELIDPAKEIASLIEGVKAGFMSLSEVQRSLGFIPSEVMAELEQDIADARAKGLVLSVDGASSQPAATASTVEDADADSEAEAP